MSGFSARERCKGWYHEDGVRTWGRVQFVYEIGTCRFCLFLTVYDFFYLFGALTPEVAFLENCDTLAPLQNLMTFFTKISDRFCPLISDELRHFSLAKMSEVGTVFFCYTYCIEAPRYCISASTKISAI